MAKDKKKPVKKAVTKKKTAVKKKATTKKKKTKSKAKSKSFIPPKLIIGGVFFLIVSIIVIVVLNIKVNHLKTEKKIIKKEIKKEIVTTKSIDNYINSLLSKISNKNNFIHLKDINAYENNFDMYYEIVLKGSYRDKFKKELSKYLTSKGFKLKDKSNIIKFEKNYQFLVIKFLDEIAKKPQAPSKHKKPELSIILDDAGRDLHTLKKILKIPYPITIATIPYMPHDIESVKLIKKAGKTAFLHLPCQPKSYPKTDPGKGAIFTNTPKPIIQATLKDVFTRLHGVDGFNNHMGSALTEDRKKMKQVLIESKKYTDIYVDSRTTPNTVAYEVCKEVGLKCGMNRKFIDNENNHQYIKDRLNDAVKYAKKHGEVIVIGHLKPDTVQVLIDYLPKLEKKGIKIVPIREVLH